MRVLLLHGMADEWLFLPLLVMWVVGGRDSLTTRPYFKSIRFLWSWSANHSRNTNTGGKNTNK
jgi:hypothetical protein